MNRDKREPRGPESLQRFCPAIIGVLRDLGGSGATQEVIDRVVEKLDISEDELEVTLKSGVSRIENQIAWARMYMVKEGLVDNSERGVWSLTERGWKAELTSQAIYQMFKRVHSKYSSQSRKGPSEESQFQEEIPENGRDDHKASLLERIISLPPAGFERICQRLLRESGFQEVVVTGKSGDGGIDGHGVLELNPLVSFKVIFQCKRYEGSVNASKVRDFRGAMMGRADKGIIITTGRFTQDARKEAIRDGVPPIELVDRDKLLEMFEKLQLGIKPRTVFDIDDSFFDDFRS